MTILETVWNPEFRVAANEALNEGSLPLPSAFASRAVVEAEQPFT